MAKYFIYSAIIFTVVIFFALTFGYEFKMERFDNSTRCSLIGPLDRWWIKNDNSIETEIVDNVKSKILCKAASEYADLDLCENMIDRTLNRYFLNAQYPHAPMIKCGTVPTVYLRPNKAGNRTIIIMTVPNKYENAQFKADLVRPDFEPKSCREILKNNSQYSDIGEHEFEELVKSSCDVDKKLQANRLSTFLDSDRLDVCVAAKNYLITKKENVPGRLPKFQGRDVEPAQSFDLKYANGFVKRVALRCPTLPRMYIYYQNLRLNADMHVILVQEPKTKN